MKCLLPFSHRRPTLVWMLCWLPHLRGFVESYWQYISTQVGRPHYGTCATLLQDTTGAVKTSKHSLAIPYHTDWPRGLPKRRNQNLSIVVFICWPLMRKLPLLRELSAFQLSDVKPKPRLSQVTFGREDIFIGNQWVLRVKTGKQPEARMVYVSRDSDWLKGLRENFLDQSKSDVLPLSGRGGGASFRDQTQGTKQRTSNVFSRLHWTKFQISRSSIHLVHKRLHHEPPINSQ